MREREREGEREREKERERGREGERAGWSVQGSHHEWTRSRV